MKDNSLKKGVLLVAAVLLSQMAQVALAQPDLNEPPKAENPRPTERPNRPANGMGVPDEAIRKMMAMGGVPEIATQDAVLAYMKEDVEARRPLREAGMKLFQALRAADVNDEQMLALVTDYRAAQETEKVRREQAQNALDAKVNFTRNPRLEAMLLLAGLIGDGGGLVGGGQGGYNPRGANFGQGGNGQGKNAEKQAANLKKLLERFDKNANGQLDPDEMAAAKQWRQERREKREQKNNPIPAPLQGDMPVAPQDRAPGVPPLPPMDDEDDLAADLAA